MSNLNSASRDFAIGLILAALLAACGAAALLLAAPAWAEGAHGVGWETLASDRVTYAQGECGGQTRTMRPSHDPWGAIGDAERRVKWAYSPPFSQAAADAWSTAYFRRFGERAGENGQCFWGGFQGADPHGLTCRGWLALAHQRGLIGQGGAWDGNPNETELATCRNSSTSYSRLRALLGMGGGGEGCEAGWVCAPLVEMPPELRPPRRPAREYSSPRSPGCWYPTSSPTGPVYVNLGNPACTAGLPEECQALATFDAHCWASEPEPPAPQCGDGTCDAGETCSSCAADCGGCAPTDPPPVPEHLACQVQILVEFSDGEFAALTLVPGAGPERGATIDTSLRPLRLRLLAIRCDGPEAP